MVASAAAGLFGAQPYQGRDCGRCNRGYYPFFGDCLQCPDPFGYTSKNALTVFGRYLIIWLLWMFINRILYAVRPTQLQRSHSRLLPTAAAAQRVSPHIDIHRVGRCDHLLMADSYALSDRSPTNRAPKVHSAAAGARVSTGCSTSLR